MDPIANFFTSNIVVVYFFYGLAFFIMGLVVWLESNRTSEFRIARAFWLLAGFGIIHGLHEWFEMFQKISQAGATNIPSWLLLDQVRIPHLVISFVLLIIFGVRLLFSTHRKDGEEHKMAYLAAGALLIVFFASIGITRQIYQPDQDEFVTMVDVLSRYTLGIPGALLAAWAIVLEQRSFRARGSQRFSKDFQWAAWALILYGVVGQFFAPKSVLFPSNIINSELFIDTFGIPVQFFRATEAALMAFFFIRALRAFELERQQQMEHAREAQLSAQKQALQSQRAARAVTEQLNTELREREEMLEELLHQVVNAQESERQRVARELHDGTGQIMTGLGLGLAAAGESLKINPDLAAEQLAELKRLNAQALQELHNVIGDLRPSTLDDLGLVPALKTQVREFETRTGVKAEFTVEGQRCRLQPELETIVFRVGQEALTNITKHAQADSVNVRLMFNANCLKLVVKDDGRGFDPDAALRPESSHRTAWGLLGIQERMALVGGICFIISKPGQGTTVHITVPIDHERLNNHTNQ